MSNPHEPGNLGQTQAPSPTVAKNHTVDAVVAVLLAILGAVVIVEARRLGAGWTTDGPGAGYFPFYIGLILLGCSLGILYQSTLGKKRDTDAFVDREQLGRVASVLIPAAIYVLVTVFLGLYVASAIYIALFMVVLGKYSWLKSVLTGVVVVAFFFLMFEVWFKVPLYKGKLEPLAFLGY
jgi:Tripartite tricarboxylate transporter TctB family